MSTLPPSRLISTNGIRLAVYEAGPEDGLPVVLCHGFPELAYSWRRQIPALAAAGCRVICPDQRGYGGSDKPRAVADYSIQHLTADLVGLLDACDIERAVFIGHDWGGLVVWQVPLLHPDRVAGVAGVGVPFIPRAAEDPIVTFRRMWGDRMYIVNFQDSQEADAVFDADPYRVFDVLLRRSPVSLEDFAKLPHEERIPDLVKRVQAGPGGGEPIVSEEDLRFYADTFAKGGFTGPINWYRNWSQNWHSTAHLPQRITVPALFIEAGNDLATAAIPDVAKLMDGHVDDLEIQRVPDSGHWIQQEYPEDVNRFLIDWLERRFMN
ncbi:MAG: alpha/beta hydrolase [Gammaproteobacteria bacterium]|nr:alpha/beta hydrolase [Gammaproteobacteria bacterium]